MFAPFVDWNIPLYQRPQHVALQLSRAGYLYFFCTRNNESDSVSGFEEIAPGCYLTDQFDELTRLQRTKLFHIYSTDIGPASLRSRTLQFLDAQLRRGNRVLYEYVDDLHPDIAMLPITDEVWHRHRTILGDERIAVVATATHLYEDVKRYRCRNLALVTNGVDVAHFAGPRSRPPPDAMLPAIHRGKPIVGYFGALARWFDYELLVRLARECDCEVLLLGPDYDGSIKTAGLEACPNISWLGPVPYRDLPRWARWFDVATIPFRLNDITRSTSPIKLFEYMALGTPIVTTDLPECRKYRSVLIAKDPADYVAQIRRALALRSDPDYLRALRAEALANTWEQKAREIAGLLRRGESEELP